MAAFAGIEFNGGAEVTIPPKIVNVLTTAERVTAYRIVNQFDGPRYETHKSKPRIGGFPITEQVTVSRAAAAGIARALTDRSAYLPEDQSWTCLFQPHHAVRFESKAGTVDAIICFECGEVMFSGAARFSRSLRRQKQLHAAMVKVLPEPRASAKRSR